MEQQQDAQEAHQGGETESLGDRMKDYEKTTARNLDPTLPFISLVSLPLSL